MLVSLLAGLTTFFAYYFLLGGPSRQERVEPPNVLPNNNDSPVVQQQVVSGELNSAQPKAHSAAVPTVDGVDDEAEKIEKLRVKLQPKALEDVDGVLNKHQFLHLHHMKTGGTCK